MHENRGHKAGFECGHQHSHRNVGLVRAKVHVGQRDGETGEHEQRGADHQIPSHVLPDAVRVFLIFLWVLRKSGRIVHGLEQIEERKDKNPDQIDKVPEQAGDFDAISQVFRIALVKRLLTGSHM